MSYTHEDLAQKDIAELKDIAAKLGVKVHHMAKAETIVYQIMQQPKHLIENALTHPAQKEVAPVHGNTPEQVREAIKRYSAKDGFKAEFRDDGTWYFHYKGAEDSGNMAIPLRVIVQKAEMVARGRRQLMSMGNDGTYKGYADNILMG